MKNDELLQWVQMDNGDWATECGNFWIDERTSVIDKGFCLYQHDYQFERPFVVAELRTLAAAKDHAFHTAQQEIALGVWELQ